MTPNDPLDRSFARAALEFGWWLVLHLCAPYAAMVLLKWLLPSHLSLAAMASDERIEQFVVHMACYSSWAAWAVLPFSKSPVARKFFGAMVFAPIPFYSFIVWACLSPVASNLGFLALMMLPAMYVSAKFLGSVRLRASGPSGSDVVYGGVGSVFLLLIFALLGVVFSTLGVVAIFLGSTFHAVMAFILMTVVLPGGLAARVGSRGSSVC